MRKSKLLRTRYIVIDLSKGSYILCDDEKTAQAWGLKCDGDYYIGFMAGYFFDRGTVNVNDKAWHEYAKLDSMCSFSCFEETLN